MVERAMLVSVYSRKEGEDHSESLLEELEALVDTLGIPVVERMCVRVPQPNAKLLVGKGKAEELKHAALECKADVVVFDNALSPAQQRNWETLLENISVIDRQEVIIDIFASRAQTKEARLQVELARMQYSMPRLKRAWTHLDRQGGGVGARGEGESQIETDRRLIRDRITKLKEEVEKVRANRATQRKFRERVPIPRAAIVGYTNAGKSSLLRKLTGADVLVENKLFATLDTTTRKIELPDGQRLLLTDTVGFVRNLPHNLVDAFKATLEEALFADFLVHVVDISHPNAAEFHNTTLKVLNELSADTKRMITVLNKCDLLVPDRGHVPFAEFPDAIPVSVHTGEGLDKLIAKMDSMLASRIRQIELLLPHHRSDLVAKIHEQGNVLSCDYNDDGTRILSLLEPKYLHEYEAFLVQDGAKVPI